MLAAVWITATNAARRASRAALAPFAIFALTGLAVPSLAPGQASPVFVDDAPGAAAALESARGQARSGNLDTAVRVLQGLLETDAARLTGAPESDGLYVTVRSRVHDALRADADLLERYRALESAGAARLLERGELEAARRERLLTPAGYEATLRLAQRHLESARFSSALRVLREVDGHPDRRAGDGSAGLAALLARYLPAARGLASAWAGEPVEVDAIEGPEVVRSRTGLDAGPAVDLERVVPRPIRSSPLVSEDEEPDGLLGAEAVTARRRGGGRVRLDPSRAVFPALAGELLLVCDGASVTALDRFTLEERWRFNPVENADPGRGRPVIGAESAGPLTVGVWGHVAAAATSSSRLRSTAGDGAVHGLDVRTGEKLWTARVDELEGLEGATPTGAVEAAEGIAVVPVLRQARERRLVSMSLVGLDLGDGSAVWSRVVASAGALPQSLRAVVGSSPEIEGGVVYFASPLGTVSALDAATGELLWARRSETTGTPAPPARALWPARPLLAGGALYALEPAGDRAFALDAETGALLGARPSASLGDPGAVYASGDALAFASERDVYAIAASSFTDEEAQPERVFTLEDGVFTGRPTTTGGLLLAPVEGGLWVIDPAGALRGVEPAARFVELGGDGNAVVAPAQVASLDGVRVSSYLVWEAAEEALTARIEADPADAAPAVTLAELAHRAGRPEAIVPAVDAALDALRRRAGTGRGETSRRRLFLSIDRMIAPRGEGAPAPPEATVEKLIARLGSAASRPGEAALHLLREAAFAEAAGRPGEAVSALQRVLDDRSLREAAVDLDGRPRLARVESTQRLRRIVASEGPGVYGVFDREAQLALERAGDDPDALTAVARRYPVSASSLRAWLEASEAFLTRGRLRGSIAALEEALAAIPGVPGAPDELVGEIAGRLAMRLVEGGRAAAASAVLARMEKARPTLALTSYGEPVDLSVLRERIAEARSREPRRARVGRLIEDAPLTAIADRLALRPLFQTVEDSHGLALLAGAERLEAWETSPEGGLARRWGAPIDPSTALLRLDSAGAIVSLGYDDERRLARLSARTGETVWETAPFGSSFAPGSTPGAAETVVVPGGTVRPRSEALVALRDDTAALIERSGRAVGYDVARGRAMWSMRLPLDRVYDAAEAGGLLAVVGTRDARDPEARVEQAPAALVVDLGTGRVRAELDLGGARPRWVRGTRDGLVVIGADRGLYGFDLMTGARRWSATTSPARRTTDAWAFPGRLIVHGGGGDLWQVEIESGELSRAPLETADRMTGDADTIRAAAAGDGAVLALPRGLVMYDRRGELTGMDHRASRSPLGPAAFGASVAVTVEPEGFEPRLYEVRVIELETGRVAQTRLVELPARPHTVDLLDGRVLIGAGQGVVVLDASGLDAKDPDADGAEVP